MYDGFAVSSSEGSGSGRITCTIAKTISRSSTSGVQILTRRTAVRTGVSGGGGVFVSSASRSSGGFGGSGCCRVRSAVAQDGAAAEPASGVRAGASGPATDPAVASGSGLRGAGAVRTSSERSGTEGARALGVGLGPGLGAALGLVLGLGPGLVLAGRSFSAVVAWSTRSAGLTALKMAVG